MTRWFLIRRSLWHYRRLNLPVALGVATATAVLTGALLVGDSVRGSLRDLTLDRLGWIDILLASDHFFRQALVDELQTTAEGRFTARPACILPRVTLERSGPGGRRASDVFLSGWDEQRGGLLDGIHLEQDQIVINQALADELDAQVGDELVLRLPGPIQVPAESLFGRKEDRVRSRSGLVVAQVIPVAGPGRFHLAASQSLPRNAFTSLQTLQRALDVGMRVNAIAVQSGFNDRSRDEEILAGLTDRLYPAPDDFGFHINDVRAVYRGNVDDRATERVAWEYINVTSERLIWPTTARDAALRAFAELEPQEVLTYLANTISVAAPGNEPARSRGIPYSTVSAVDPHPTLGPLHDAVGPLPGLEPDEILFNSWAAEDLGVHPGETISLSYFAPETTHGDPVERTAEFRLRDVLPLVAPARPYRGRQSAVFDRPPGPVNDPDLTPVVKGVTDQEAIDDWDPPFPFDPRRVRGVDDDYWSSYRTTPKAFIALGRGKRLWGSRFGSTTSLRIPKRSASKAEIAARFSVELNKVKSALGFRFVPVKRDGLRAAAGTTSFEWLFLGFSVYLIASALMLIAILFRLGIQIRAPEIGILRALGWQAGRTRQVMLSEAALVGVTGAMAGLAGGVAYAALLLAGLRTCWLAAIVTPFLRLHVTTASVVAGGLSGILMGLLVMIWTLRGLRRSSTIALISGRGASGDSPRKAGRSTARLAAAMAVVGLLIGGWAPALSGEAQAGAFLGSGAAFLVALLLLVRSLLDRAGGKAGPGPQGIATLAWRAAARHPTRSALTIGLMSAACFLIVAIDAFRLEGTGAGTGGFDLLAESDQPIFSDLSSQQVRQRLFGTDADALRGVEVVSMRVRGGEEASCRNLFRASQPRLLGVTPEMVEYFDDHGDQFGWSAPSHSGAPNHWHLLLEPHVGDAIPVVLDKNTAMYSLHLRGHVGEEFTLDEYATPVRFRIVGLLSNTILQGSLLVSAADLVRLFPQTEGYQLFLIRSPQAPPQEVALVLEDRFSDEGLDVRPTAKVMEELIAVQNTYLSAFQSLGALGLLLGAVGLAVVQLRSVMERRSEFALLKALGYPRARIRLVVLLEVAMLLGVGLGTGLLAAMVTVVPFQIVGAARTPLGSVCAMICVVFAGGMLSAGLAVRAAVRAPVLAALRGE
jgi:ABC-type antimicrobial peptide transport system permease subunit